MKNNVKQSFIALLTLLVMIFNACPNPTETNSSDDPSIDPMYFYIDPEGNFSEADSGRTLVVADDKVDVLFYSDDTETDIDRVGFTFEDKTIVFFFEKDQGFPISMVESDTVETINGFFTSYDPVTQTYSITFQQGDDEEIWSNISLNKEIFTQYNDNTELTPSQNLRMRNLFISMSIYISLYDHIALEDALQARFLKSVLRFFIPNDVVVGSILVVYGLFSMNMSIKTGNLIPYTLGLKNVADGMQILVPALTGQPAPTSPGGSLVVNYNLNGGSGMTPASHTVPAGSSMTLRSNSGFSRTGYTFAGWNTNSAGTGTNRNAGSSFTPTGNTTLYARWTSTVRYNINNGTGTTPTAQTVNAGSSTTLPVGTGFSRTGYAFSGWSLNTAGVGINYNAGSSYTPTGNVTLYARWIFSNIVSFNINGGTGTTPAAHTVNSGSSTILPTGTGFSREGYAFTGWNTNAAGIGINYNAGSSYTPTGDVTLYARWVLSNTVSFNLNGGSGTTPASQTVNSGSSTTLPGGAGFSRSGYTFAGWNTNTSGTGTNYNANSSYTPTGNITLYARWTSTVTYNINNGTGTTPAAQTVNAGASIATNSGTIFSRPGYTFAGWNTNAAGTGTNYNASVYYTPTGNITLYARWTSTVTYNINDGTGTTPAAQTVNAGTSTMLSGGSEFSRNGYTFIGWNTNATGSGTNYDAGSSYTPTGNITLYARWILAHTVSYDINGGTGTAPAAHIVNAGSNTTLPGGTGFSRSGYSFAGWNTNSSGTGTNYSANSSYTPTGNITLYARWTSTVTYNINNGSGTTPTAQTANAGSSVTLNNGSGFSRTGYTFAGWSTNSSGTGTNYSANSSYTPTGNITLYARWTSTVTYNINSGTGTTPAAQTVNAGSSVTLNNGSGFSRTGYTFAGWNTNAAGTGTNYSANSSYTPTGNITLYARWTSSTIPMVWIPGGNFQMGSNNPDDYASPVHTVTLSGFYMGIYQVTQEQWTTVMTGNNNGISSNPSFFTPANGEPPASGEVQGKRPVESVSWYDVIVFCNRLSIIEGLGPAYRINGSTNPDSWGTVPTNNSNATWDAVQIVSGSTGYRLPTEAQWEYAARGGNGTPGNYTYSGSNNLGAVAWYWSNSNSRTHEVGLKQPNGLGLYDMSGNVWEWCWDWHGSYTSSAKTNPSGAASGNYRVLRGGSWNSLESSLRSVYRSNGRPWDLGSNGGFRLVRP